MPLTKSNYGIISFVVGRVKKVSLLGFLACLGFIVLPFVFWPKAQIPYEIPRVWFVIGWIDFMIFVSILSFYRLRRTQKIDTTLIIIAISFLVVVAFSSLQGVDLVKSLWGNLYRLDGLITLGHLVALFFIIGLFINSSDIKAISLGIFLGSFLQSILTLYLNFRYYFLGHQSIPNFQGVIGSTFGQPVFLAGYLLVTLPFTLYFYYSTSSYKTRIFLTIALIIQIVAIFLTKSWGGVLGLILFFILWVGLMAKKTKPLKVTFIAIFFLLASLLYVVNQNKVLKEARSENPTLVIAEDRSRIIVKGLMAFIQKPILGWGWANYDYAFESVDWPVHFENDVYVDKGHSHLLEILVTTGLLGLVSYIFILGRGFVNLSKDRSVLPKILLLSLVLFVFHSQTNVISIAEELIFWFILGSSIKPY